MYQVNQKFRHALNGKIYVIKGAWDGKFTGNDHAFLMCEDFVGHAYSGSVTPVNSVWNISQAEFDHMAGGRPEWMIEVQTSPAEQGEPSKTILQQSKAGSEDFAQISAFVEWVASLSKTEYAAHEQLVCVIEKAQKLLPC